MTGGSAVCSGTLVHPEIVVYAAHCPLALAVSFGEGSVGIGLARVVPVDHCMKKTDADVIGPDDYAYCKLAEPVTDV